MRNDFFESVQEIARQITLGDGAKAMEELTVLAIDRGHINADGLEAIQRGKAQAEQELRRAGRLAPPAALSDRQQAYL